MGPENSACAGTSSTNKLSNSDFPPITEDRRSKSALTQAQLIPMSNGYHEVMSYHWIKVAHLVNNPTRQPRFILRQNSYKPQNLFKCLEFMSCYDWVNDRNARLGMMSRILMG